MGLIGTSDGNTAALDALTQEQDDKYRPSSAPTNEQSVSPQQTIASRVMSSFDDPYNNMKNNWNNMTDAYSKGNYGQGLFDTYRMAKNPTGNWGGQPSQATPQSQAGAVQFQDHHLDAPDANGIRPINEAGKQHAIVNMPNIADNSSLASKFDAKASPPSASQAPSTHGWIGRFVDQYAQLGGSTANADTQTS